MPTSFSDSPELPKSSKKPTKQKRANWQKLRQERNKLANTSSGVSKPISKAHPSQNNLGYKEITINNSIESPLKSPDTIASQPTTAHCERRTFKKVSSKPVKAYLTKPLCLYQLVASTSGPSPSAAGDHLHSVYQTQDCRRSPRKLLRPLRRLEALDFDGQPVPTLGRMRLAVTDEDERQMRWHQLCLVCHKQLHSPSQLFAHLEAHNLILNRASRKLLAGRIRCCLCLELLLTWKRLHTHMQRHTGYQPHRCRHCAETFSSSGNLKRHMGRKHGSSLETADSPDDCDAERHELQVNEQESD